MNLEDIFRFHVDVDWCHISYILPKSLPWRSAVWRILLNPGSSTSTALFIPQDAISRQRCAHGAATSPSCTELMSHAVLSPAASSPGHANDHAAADPVRCSLPQ
jgi:hypothetical protein